MSTSFDLNSAILNEIEEIRNRVIKLNEKSMINEDVRIEILLKILTELIVVRKIVRQP